MQKFLYLKCMGTFSNDFVKRIYNLPKTPEAVSAFLNSEWIEELPNGKTRKRMMWERFEAPYVKVTRHYVAGTDDDEADIYLYAHKLISRCVLAKVAPYFESDGQLFSYFQLMVKNTRINNSIKAEKQSFLLIGDLIKDGDADEQDYSNFEEKVLGASSEVEYNESLSNVYDMIDELKDDELVMFGRLFVANNFSFEGMYGLCGFDLKKFKETKKRFIMEMRKLYE